MKNLLRIEQLAIASLSFYLFLQIEERWWLYFLLLLLPDIGMVGYIFGNKIGALSYNFLHHQGVAIGLLLVGMIFEVQFLGMLGAIMLGHSALDRVMGYGLKLGSGFKDTHLGKLN